MKFLAHIFSLLAFGLSSLLTIQLLTSRTDGWFAFVMMALMGFVAEGGKGLLFYHGIKAHRAHKRLSAISSLVVAGFLIFLSILGTVAALNMSENKAKDAAIEKTFDGQTATRLLSRAKELRSEAASLPEIYRSGKIRRNNEAWALEQQAQDLLRQHYKGPADYFDRIAAFLHISPLQAQTLIFWGYGFALELIACLLAIIGLNKEQDRPVTTPPAETPKIAQTAKNVALPQPPNELKEALKVYIEKMDGQRFKGLTSSGLSRSMWERCVSHMNSLKLIRKNEANQLEATVPKELLKRWVS